MRLILGGVDELTIMMPPLHMKSLFTVKLEALHIPGILIITVPFNVSFMGHLKMLTEMVGFCAQNKSLGVAEKASF